MEKDDSFEYSCWSCENLELSGETWVCSVCIKETTPDSPMGNWTPKITLDDKDLYYLLGLVPRANREGPRVQAIMKRVCENLGITTPWGECK